MRNYTRTCKSNCSYNLVYNFLIQLLPLKISVFVVHFSYAFWNRNEAFPKGSSWNEIVPLLVIFHLPFSKYRGERICFYSCRYQNQNFSLVSHSCHSFSNRVTLVSFIQHSCRTCVSLLSLLSPCVALVLLVLHLRQSRRNHVACVWHSCCKLDQISPDCK